MNLKDKSTGAVVGLGCLLIIMIFFLHILAVPFGIIFVVKAIWGISLSYWVVLVAWWILIILFNVIRGKK